MAFMKPLVPLKVSPNFQTGLHSPVLGLSIGFCCKLQNPRFGSVFTELCEPCEKLNF